MKTFKPRLKARLRKNKQVLNKKIDNLDDVKKIIAIKQYWLDEVAPYFSYSIDE